MITISFTGSAAEVRAEMMALLGGAEPALAAKPAEPKVDPKPAPAEETKAEEPKPAPKRGRPRKKKEEAEKPAEEPKAEEPKAEETPEFEKPKAPEDDQRDTKEIALACLKEIGPDRFRKWLADELKVDSLQQLSEDEMTSKARPALQKLEKDVLAELAEGANA